MLEQVFHMSDIYLPITLYTDYEQIPGREHCDLKDKGNYFRQIREQRILPGTRRLIFANRYTTSANNIADKLTKPLKNSPDLGKDLMQNLDRMNFIGLQEEKNRQNVQKAYHLHSQQQQQSNLLINRSASSAAVASAANAPTISNVRDQQEEDQSAIEVIDNNALPNLFNLGP